MSRFAIASLLALAASTMAITYPPSAVTGTEGIIASSIFFPLPPTAVPATMEGVALADPPEYFTLVVINSHGDDITTSHAHAADSPTAVSGDVGPGTMTNGATASVLYPTGWAGNVAINDANYEITGDDSLIEASFVVEDDVAVVDVDISYVNGFSVAIVCWCTDTDVSLTGCNKNLYTLNTCPDPDGENACINPLRASTTATEATTFFEPCEGAAYTFPDDNAANSYGQCQSGSVTCCVGADCPASSKQSS
ncbi:hypothetical protein ASPZODRAFT_155442 [Penicilliopsis zonata CBS 506.65]|uniref:Uncharacterized protein n=1 Tax=Penicilliopsis zonata CBS 506.65 TaxID=1073090 RepID=A0A1L9S4Z4_9EURO|nr:hypothetical protein ASPZODRAFT_155442 [Penicilliopsis zonata CBS 506.65]OJJ42225.1 hypothetical protein ASPZODRAFT_155442 [Penicilliopsis zonata CBS 506.65]